MVEVFTAQRGGEGQIARQVATDVTLSQPVDVYFGPTAPGIAFYEKSGADLLVTLLDGTEVVLRNFFVIGEGGGYSRLLLAESGAVEITGLVAPEPLMPAGSEPAAVAIAAAEPEPAAAPPAAPPAPAPAPAAAAAPQPMALAEPAFADGPAEGDYYAPAAAGSQGPLFGVPSDQLLFLAGMVPVTGAMAFHGNGSSGNSSDTAQDVSSDTSAGEGEAADAGQETDGQETGDAELAALLAGPDEGDDELEFEPADPGAGLGDGAPEDPGLAAGLAEADPVFAALDLIGADPI